MYTCPVCGATSSDAGVLERHMATHEAPEPPEPTVPEPPAPEAEIEELAAEGVPEPPRWSAPVYEDPA